MSCMFKHAAPGKTAVVRDRLIDSGRYFHLPIALPRRIPCAGAGYQWGTSRQSIGGGPRFIFSRLAGYPAGLSLSHNAGIVELQLSGPCVIE